MENLSDKELLKQGRYFEALGDNYNPNSICIFLIKDGICVDDEYPSLKISKQYSCSSDAIRCIDIMTKRYNLPNNMWYMMWDSNSDWL